MSSKRKHTTLTIETKHEIIKLLDRGERVNALAARYGVGRATVYDIQRNRGRIEEFVAGRRAEAGSRQTLKRGEFPGVEEALYAWYVQRRRRDDGPVSGAALARRALSVHRHLQQADGGGGAPFKASVGWLNKFKKRYGILSGCPHADRDDDDDDDRPPPPPSGDDEDVLVGRWSRASSSSSSSSSPDDVRGPPPAVEICFDDDDDEMRTAAETSDQTSRDDCRTVVDSFDECVAWAEENGVPGRDLRVLRKLRHDASEQLRRLRLRRQRRSPDRNNIM